MTYQIVLRTIFAIMFVFCSSNLTSAQLKPAGNSGQVFVDFSVLDEIASGNFSKPLIPTENKRIGILKPPAKMPRSQFLMKRETAKISPNLSPIKLKPLTKVRKTRPRIIRVGKEIKESNPGPKVLKNKSIKIKSLGAKSVEKLSTPRKKDPKKPVKLQKLESKTSLKNKPNTAPAPKALPKAPVKILAEAPPTPEIVKSVSKTDPILTKLAALPGKEELNSGANVLIFRQGDAKLTVEAKETLNKLSSKLKVNQDSRMQLQAYAGEPNLSASRARRLSLSRALSARSYLIKKGIRSTRIDVRALGNKISTGEPNRVDLKFIKN